MTLFTPILYGVEMFCLETFRGVRVCLTGSIDVFLFSQSVKNVNSAANRHAAHNNFIQFYYTKYGNMFW